MNKPKTFIAAIKMLSTDPLKAKQYFNDKRLTQNEKNILKSFYHLRDNKFELVKVEIESLFIQESPVVEAIRLQLLGLMYNSISSFELAEKFLKNSLFYLKGQGLSHYELISHYNLFVIAFNQKDELKMRFHIKNMNKLPQATQQDKIDVLRCLLSYYTFINEFKKAHSIMNSLDSKSEYLVESDLASYLVDKINLYIKEERFKECFEILEEMKKIRKYQLTENFKFLKILLNNVVYNKPIYFSESYFKRVPLLLYQMNVIKAFEENDIESAESSWNKLKQFSGQIYQFNFNYQGDKCLFSIALQKYLQRRSSPKFDLEGCKTQHDKIISVLQQTKIPIHKNDLYEIVYQKKPLTKQDYQTLAKAIYRLKAKMKINIKFVKSCYSLSTT